LNLPGRNGLDLTLNLYYNSRIWEVDASTPAQPSISFDSDRDFPSYGFRLDFGYLEANTQAPFILTDADGTKHAFSGTGTSFDSTDGTFIHYDSAGHIVTYASGSTVQYEVFPTETNLYRPIKIKDTDGNFITITYVPGAGNNQHISTIIDTLGRVLTFNYNASNQLASITQNVAVSSVDPTGVHTYATFSWAPLYGAGYVWYNFSASAVVLAPALTSALNVLTKCTYPNQTAYRFTYGDWAVISKIENLSANGTVRSYISYNYPAASAGALSDAPAYTTQVVSPDGLTTNLSSWAYGFAKSGTGSVTSTVITDQLNNVFTANLNADGTLSSLVDADSAGHTLSNVAFTWKAVGSSVRPDVVTTTNDAAQQSSVQYFYDSNGNVTDLYEKDFSGTTVRHTVTSYKQAPFTTQHILNLPASVTVKNGSDVIIARTDFDYDTSTISPTIGGLPTHDDSTGSTRGNLTSVTRYSDPVTPSGGIPRTFTYDSLGNLRIAQMDCCNQKTFNFSSLTQYAYPDSIVRGSSPQFTSSFTYNFDTGALKTSTDENGQQTQYQYNDSLYRLTAMLPPPSNGTTVQNNVAFDDASAFPVVTQSSTVNSAVLIQTFDGLGHLIQQDTSNGSVISSVKRIYDKLWRQSQVSNPYAPGETPVYTTFGYDGLGRTTSIAPSSGGSTVISLAGNTTTITDPAGKTRKNYFDALGRLAQVDEPGGSSPGSNALGSLTIGNTLRSQSGVGAYSATWSSGYVEIDGSIAHIDSPDGGCQPLPRGCPQIYDRGFISITINGITSSTSYNQFSTNTGLATNLASNINGGSAASLVTATASGSRVNLVSKGTGVAVNYSLSSNATTSDTTDFADGESFIGYPSGGSMTGGVDAYAGVTVYDQGTVTVTIGSFTASAPYSQTGNSTAAQVAAALVTTGSTGLNRSGSPVSATVNGASITINYLALGSAGNLGVTASSTSTQTQASFPGGSFSGSSSLTRGADPYPSGLAHPFSTTYTYDVLDHLTGVSQAAGIVNGVQTSGQPRSFSYDSLGRLVTSTTPESGTVSNYYTTSTGASCAGDPALVCRIVDARGVVKNLSYDGINRISGVSYTNDPAGTPGVVYHYDAGGQAAFALDRLTSINEGTNSQTFTYDNLGRMATVTDLFDGVSYPLTYAYNPANQVSSVTYPSGRIVSQNYDTVGRMQSIASAGITYLSVVNPATDYNAAGQLKAVTYGNGVQGAFTYNDHLQLATLRYYKPGAGSDVLNLSYDYTMGVPGNNGQIQAVHYYTSPGVEDTTKSEYFTYDNWSRLSAAQTGTVNSTPGTWSLVWGYDRLSNRLSQTLTGGNVSIGQPQFVVDQNTNRITTSGYTYDAAGNMTHDANTSYGFDGANRLISANNGSTPAAYTYFGALRIKKVVGSVTTVAIYSGTKPIAEYVNAALSKEYIYSGSSLLATISGGVATYHHPDHLSNRAETDSNGNLVRTYGHFPFGETWYETGTADKWKFTSYARDLGETNLDYAGFRHYGSLLGRFASPDLLAGNILNPQSLNRYSYTLADPVSLVDPLGLEGGGSICFGAPVFENGNFAGCLDDPFLKGNKLEQPGNAGGGGGPVRSKAKDKINDKCLQFILDTITRAFGAGNDAAASQGHINVDALQAQKDVTTKEVFIDKMMGRNVIQSNKPMKEVPDAVASASGNTVTLYPLFASESESQKEVTMIHENFHGDPYDFSDSRLADALGVKYTVVPNDPQLTESNASAAWDKKLQENCGTKK
jgi:RHS repeat-associated protein